MEIRQATIDDSYELARLRWDFSPDEVRSGVQSFHEFTKQFEKWLSEALGSKITHIWVVAKGASLSGNIYLQIVPKIPRPGRFHACYGYLTNVYLQADLRGLGVGSRLMTTVIDWAREERLEFLIVWPSTESVTYYERLGFRQSAEALELTLSY